MENLFVPYEIETKLESLGLKKLQVMDNFGIPIEGILFQQALDWFREKHNLHIEVLYQGRTTGDYMSFVEPNAKEAMEVWNGRYYESLNKAIEQALTLI